MTSELTTETKLESWAGRSPSIGKLAAALSKAQAVLEAAKKDSKNPYFNSKYADLASVWAAIREPLAANELSVLQEPSADTGKVTITTTLMHSSGEYIRSSLVIPVSKQDAQGYGSAITYARRYALQSVVGIAPEDDDGNAAAGQGSAPKVPAKQPQQIKQPEPITKYFYDLNAIPEDKLGASVALLEAAKAEEISFNVWKSPIEIKKLVNYRSANAE